jgi:acyl-ACP thioesterase
MKQEKDCIYEILTTASYLNQHRQLKPYAYQILFEQMAERHLSDLGLNVDTTMQYGLAWALISMSLEVTNPIEDNMTLYGSTWFSQHKGPYFRRELLFRDETGRLMFQGSTHSVLLDMEKRTVFRKKVPPFPMHEPTEQFLVDASPGFRMEAELFPIQERSVQPSHIDCLGHVNNCRYGEFIYDTFSDEEQENLKHLKRMDIHFLSELRKGDLFTINKSSEENRLYFQGFNRSKEDVSFHIMLQFFDHGKASLESTL